MMSGQVTVNSFLRLVQSPAIWRVAVSEHDGRLMAFAYPAEAPIIFDVSTELKAYDEAFFKEAMLAAGFTRENEDHAAEPVVNYYRPDVIPSTEGFIKVLSDD